MKTHFECGLSAFPDENHRGMTLRDYFAAKAMMALIAHPDSDGDKPPSVFANSAYVMADAMLKARGE